MPFYLILIILLSNELISIVCNVFQDYTALESAHLAKSDRAPEQFHNVIVVKFIRFILILIYYARINYIFF